MTTNFFVLQAQRDLNQARNNELQALIDYLKSVVNYETAQVAPLGAGAGVTVISGVGGRHRRQHPDAAAAAAPAVGPRRNLVRGVPALRHHE